MDCGICKLGALETRKPWLCQFSGCESDPDANLFHLYTSEMDRYMFLN